MARLARFVNAPRSPLYALMSLALVTRFVVLVWDDNDFFVPKDASFRDGELVCIERVNGGGEPAESNAFLSLACSRNSYLASGIVVLLLYVFLSARALGIAVPGYNWPPPTANDEQRMLKKTTHVLDEVASHVGIALAPSMLLFEGGDGRRVILFSSLTLTLLVCGVCALIYFSSLCRCKEGMNHVSKIVFFTLWANASFAILNTGYLVAHTFNVEGTTTAILSGAAFVEVSFRYLGYAALWTSQQDELNMPLGTMFGDLPCFNAIKLRRYKSGRSERASLFVTHWDEAHGDDEQDGVEMATGSG